MFRRDNISRLINRNRIAGRSVISIMSGKGGVGKSVIAFNLAERLSSLGRRVLLVDADLGGGNVHILANQNCDVGIEHVVNGQLSLSEAVTNVMPRLDILASVGIGPDSTLQTIEAVSSLAELLRSPATEYDFVILDHSSGISKSATALACASDLTMILVVPEITSIADAYGLLKYMVDIGGEVDCRLLVNRTMEGDEAEYIHRKFGALSERFLSIVPALIGSVSEDSQIRQAVGSQLPLIAVAPDSIALQELTLIAQTLAHEGFDSNKETNLVKINGRPAAADIKG